MFVRQVCRATAAAGTYRFVEQCFYDSSIIGIFGGVFIIMVVRCCHFMMFVFMFMGVNDAGKRSANEIGRKCDDQPKHQRQPPEPSGIRKPLL